MNTSSNDVEAPDFLVIGAGVVGVAVANRLKERFPDQSVLVIEKEADVAQHASGRNSGVIHAGFYYSADSMKARLTRAGNQRLKQFCRERSLALNECGKLVVATKEEDLAQFDVLLQRAKANGVPLEMVDEKQARTLEPRAKVFGGKALWSPSTASADPLAVVQKMRELGGQRGVRYEFNTRFVARERGGGLRTAAGKINPGFVLNTAGLYADAVAHQYGVGESYEILPYKGLYLYSSENPGAFRTNIYPVPDLRNPFLGVHFTVTVDGRAKIGPTAIPALWREQYDGVEGFRLGELASIGWRNFQLLFNGGQNFAALAVEELKNLNRRHLVKLAARLAEGVRDEHFRAWGRPGIRAQLVDRKSRKLVSDFVLEKGEKSLHVLNAVSPAWTCALPLADLIVDSI